MGQLTRLAVFTKCKHSIHDGTRLENISWRLWFRSMHLKDGLCSPVQETKPGFPFSSLSPVYSEKREFSPRRPRTVC
jgi:hypothetical protein